MNHNSNHGGHNKIMWLMMLMCAVPVLLVLLSGSNIRNYALLFLLICCVGGHFLMMKFMGHKAGHKGEDLDKNRGNDNDGSCH